LVNARFLGLHQSKAFADLTWGNPLLHKNGLEDLKQLFRFFPSRFDFCIAANIKTTLLKSHELANLLWFKAHNLDEEDMQEKQWKLSYLHIQQQQQQQHIFLLCMQGKKENRWIYFEGNFRVLLSIHTRSEWILKNPCDIFCRRRARHWYSIFCLFYTSMSIKRYALSCYHSLLSLSLSPLKQ